MISIAYNNDPQQAHVPRVNTHDTNCLCIEYNGRILYHDVTELFKVVPYLSRDDFLQLYTHYFTEITNISGDLLQDEEEFFDHVLSNINMVPAIYYGTDQVSKYIVSNIDNFQTYKVREHFTNHTETIISCIRDLLLEFVYVNEYYFDEKVIDDLPNIYVEQVKDFVDKIEFEKNVNARLVINDEEHTCLEYILNGVILPTLPTDKESASVYKLVHKLLEYGALNVDNIEDVITEFEGTILACKYTIDNMNIRRIIRTLCSFGLDMNNDNIYNRITTILKYIAFKNNKYDRNAFADLVDISRDSKNIMYNSEPVVMHAIKNVKTNKYSAIMDTLCSHDNINVKNSENHTAFMYLCTPKHSNCMDAEEYDTIIKHFHDNYVDINAEDIHGNSAIKMSYGNVNYEYSQQNGCYIRDILNKYYLNI